MGAAASFAPSKPTAWDSLSPDDALALVNAEEGQTVSGETMEELLSGLAAVPFDQDGAAVPTRLIADGVDLSEGLHALAGASAAQPLGVLSLNGCSLAMGGDCIGDSIPFQVGALRSLTLSGNAVTRLPNLTSCPLLVDLDLSYCEDIVIDDPSIFAAVSETLVRLNLTSCGLSSLLTEAASDGGEGAGDGQGTPNDTTLLSIFGGLTQLKQLFLGENDLDGADLVAQGLQPIAGTLQELELAENPISETSGYSKQAFITETLHLSNLRTFDGKGLSWRAGTSKHVALATAINADSERAQANFDPAGSASLESEFQAAVSGQVDSTVVS